MLRRLALIISSLIVSISCSKNEKNGGADAYSPELTVQAMNGLCLDLETIVHQMDDSRFQFPGYVYTRNFEVLGSSGSAEFIKTLTARSFRAESVRVKSLGDLRGVKQNGCDSIVMADTGGIALTYKITAYTDRELELELDTEAQKEAVSGLSKAHSEAILEFPANRKITVKVLSPTRVEMINTYRTIPIECPKVSSTEVLEHLVFQWTGQDGGGTERTARLNPGYLRRLSEAANFAVRAQERQTTEELVELTSYQSQELLQALKARMYAPCR